MIENYEPPSPLVLTPQMSPHESFDEKDKDLMKDEKSRGMTFARRTKPDGGGVWPESEGK